jgi:hypothetical protein
MMRVVRVTIILFLVAGAATLIFFSLEEANPGYAKFRDVPTSFYDIHSRMARLYEHSNKNPFIDILKGCILATNLQESLQLEPSAAGRLKNYDVGFSADKKSYVLRYEVDKEELLEFQRRVEHDILDGVAGDGMLDDINGDVFGCDCDNQYYCSKQDLSKFDSGNKI